jgi:hypothetical protein
VQKSVVTGVAEVRCPLGEGVVHFLLPEVEVQDERCWVVVGERPLKAQWES